MNDQYHHRLKKVNQKDEHIMIPFVADEDTDDHDSSESEPLEKPVFLIYRKVLNMSPDCEEVKIVPVDDSDEEMREWWKSDEAAFWMGM